MEIKIPYGRGEIPLRVPDQNVLGVFYPNEVEGPPEREALLSALENPISSPSFEEFLEGSRDVLLIVNDGTRPTPTAKVLEMIRGPLSKVDHRFIIATGCHRAPTEEEYRFIFGGLYKETGDRVHVHASREEKAMVYLGASSNGTEMYVNRLGVEAEKLVAISSVEPHYFGGYTGGRKSFLPGIASYRTIEQNHKYAIRPEAKALALSGNPVHEDMIDALRTVHGKEIFSIQVVLDRERRIYGATAGDIHASFDAAVEKANEVFCVEVPRKADIVVSVAPYPMDVDLYQSQKALENGKLALKEGGILIMVSKCRTGVGEKAFFELLAGAKTPKEALEKIDQGYLLGYHKAAKMAEIALWAEMWAVTDLPESDIRSVFMRPFADLQGAVDAALETKGRGAEILFLMDGSITVPMIKDARERRQDA
ncbi:MAG: nickel-dependent lactate racemase [Thermodesulfobacteriota bacterium]